MRFLFVVFTAMLGPTIAGHPDAAAGFSVEIKGEVNPFTVFSVFLLPDQETNVQGKSAIHLNSANVKCQMEHPWQWIITAPSRPGVYTLIISSENDAAMHINVLVLTPISQKKREYLNGYRIGNYPSTPLRGNPIYNRPEGLFEVTEENIDLKLTPHFTIRQFLCKQASTFPKYVIVQERLLLKLEYLLKKVNENDIGVETFGFISGYRTPYYNKAIKNVTYSRHVYGGAADIFIDQNNDGHMDDLNGDGVTDNKDVRIFYDIVDKLFPKPEYSLFKGGLGLYRGNSVHRGFIHVDVRGSKARW